MHYSILIYGTEGVFERLPAERQEEIMREHKDLQEQLAARGPFATAKLAPVSAAVTLRPTTGMDARTVVTDGPFAETKERLLGFYVAECSSLEDAIAMAQKIAAPFVSLEVRPVSWAGGLLAED